MRINKGDQLLHTDILKKLYSPITLAIESQTDRVRKAHLLDNLGISRTYAITHFHSLGWSSEIMRIVDKIKQNESAGETFRANGYQVNKKTIYVGRVKLSEKLSIMMSSKTNKGTLCQYTLSVVKGISSPVTFATITEIYSADLSEALEKEKMLIFTPEASPIYISDFEDNVVL